MKLIDLIFVTTLVFASNEIDAEDYQRNIRRVGERMPQIHPEKHLFHARISNGNEEVGSVAVYGESEENPDMLVYSKDCSKKGIPIVTTIWDVPNHSFYLDKTFNGKIDAVKRTPEYMENFGEDLKNVRAPMVQECPEGNYTTMKLTQSH